jgi:hypothetical protein
MVEKAKQPGEEVAIGIEKAIPEKLRANQKAEPAVAQFMLNIHTAVKAYIDSVQKNATGRVLRLFLGPFEELDESINTTISNIQLVDHEKKMSCYHSLVQHLILIRTKRRHGGNVGSTGLDPRRSH